LNYGSTSPTFSTASGITLGDQTNLPNGSLLVTSGQISPLITAEYDTSATSVDLALCALDPTGTTKTNNSTSLWLTSPNLRTGFGYANEPGSTGANVNFTAPNVTYIATAPTSINFATVAGADLATLPISTSSTQEVLITNGGVYQFLTAKGKKGLIQVTNIVTYPNNGSNGGSTATLSVKVQN
jgi:hypothetical protein